MDAGFRIREAVLPKDRPAILSFIMGIQHFENAIEPDRRIDPGVAEEYYVVIRARTAERKGKIFLADDAAGRSVGWAVVHEDQNEVFVVADERIYDHIAELYVVEEARGRGVGAALIASCEEWARQRGFKTIMIGALAANSRALDVYRDSGYTPYATLLRKYLP